MVLSELYVISITEGKILKQYPFNKCGVNVILGVAKNDSTGVGKTSMIEAIRMVLGLDIPNDFKGKAELLKKDILIAMKVETNNRTVYLGRQIIDSKHGFISDDLLTDIRGWNMLELNAYRQIVQRYVYENMSSEVMPTLQAVREYIVRDEKQGFPGIGLNSRKPTKVNQILCFLSLIPNNFEEEINVIRKQKAELDAKIKLIKVISKDIKQLRNEKLRLDSEILKTQKLLEDVDISQKVDIDETNYKKAKEELREVQRQIFKNEYSKKQFEENIENLSARSAKVNELIDLKDFYNQLICYFPDKLLHNYEEMKTFFEFMLQNRGDYFSKRIKEVDTELVLLHKKKEELQSVIKESSKVYQNTKIIDDMHEINNQLNSQYMKLAEVKAKIDQYDSISDLTKEINDLEKDILEKIEAYQTEFNKYSQIVMNIQNHFNNLVQEAYNEKGELTYSFNNEHKAKSTTGRILINCQITEENSHGKLYMKINMFDLALLLNRIDNNAGCKFLIHDGSYCKPNANAKYNVLTYVNSYLKERGEGQYFITINRTELETEQLNEIKAENMIVAEFDREGNYHNRFFGFKY